MYKNRYGIFELKEHDYGGREKPMLVRGWFDTEKEANECLNKYYDGGEKKRYDNNFYGWHYIVWHEIYVFNDEVRPYCGFYDMGDCVKELVNNGEWDKMSKEQQDVLIAVSPSSAKLWLAFKGKTGLGKKSGTVVDGPEKE